VQQRLDGLSASDSSSTKFCSWGSFSLTKKNKDKPFRELQLSPFPTSTFDRFTCTLKNIGSNKE